MRASEAAKDKRGWILLWDMASTQATSYLQPCDVAVFNSFKSCIQAQASAALARSVGDSHRLNGRLAQSRTSAPRTRSGHAQSDAEFREAVVEANELHATGAFFARQIEPGPAPEDAVDWAMAEASDDEDDAPMPDALLEPELIDMPPAPHLRYPP